MSCGVPCVVTDVGDSAYIVGDTGFVVPPRAPEAMAAAWESMLTMSRNERKAMGGRARRRVVEHFELGKIVRHFEDFYLKIMESRH